MSCYHPIPAHQAAPGLPVRLLPDTSRAANLALPCGKCIGCRTDRATQWAHRCTHEASLWPVNSFLTLTYDDENVPAEGHLQPRHLTLFLKRLRKHAHSNGSRIDSARSGNIRYFACGEYGETNQRPHYHVLTFNCGFSDQIRVGRDLYESETLRALWPHGLHRIGNLTPAAAAYVAQYNLKKIGAGDADPDGVWRPAPFLRMSLKPAIGARWLDQYADDLRHGYLVQDNRPTGIPRAYRKRLHATRPELETEIQHNIQRRGILTAASTHTTPVAVRPREGAPAEATTTAHHPGFDRRDEQPGPAGQRALTGAFRPTAGGSYGPQLQHYNNTNSNNHPDRLADAEIIHKRRKQLRESRTL